MREDPTILHRDDLLIREWGEFNYGAGVHQRSHRTAQDADLRELGYVRLDGVDVETLAAVIRKESEQWFGDTWGGLADEADDLAQAVLAALAEGDTTNE